MPEANTPSLRVSLQSGELLVVVDVASGVCVAEEPQELPGVHSKRSNTMFRDVTMSETFVMTVPLRSPCCSAIWTAMTLISSSDLPLKQSSFLSLAGRRSSKTKIGNIPGNARCPAGYTAGVWAYAQSRTSLMSPARSQLNRCFRLFFLCCLTFLLILVFILFTELLP